MTHKSEASYAAVLNWVQQQASAVRPNDPRPIHCTEICTDFESGLLPAIQHHDFGAPPPVQSKGCHFHQGQSVMKSVQNEGLSVVYRNDPAVNKIIRGLMSIGFLPVNQVIDGFEEFRNSPAVLAKIAQYPTLQNVFTTFDTTWIHGQYPLAMWNVSTPKVLRTNNNIEGFHRDANVIFGPHPHLWEFINKAHRLQKREEIWLTKWLQGDEDAIQEPRRPKYKMKERKLYNLIQTLNHNDCTRLQFIYRVAKYQGFGHFENNAAMDADYAAMDDSEPEDESDSEYELNSTDESGDDDEDNGSGYDTESDLGTFASDDAAYENELVDFDD